jgi:hypothetical protein
MKNFDFMDVTLIPKEFGFDHEICREVYPYLKQLIKFNTAKTLGD